MANDFGTLVNAEIQKPKITDAEFVKITIPGTEALGGPTFFFSSSYKNETVLDPISGTSSVSSATYLALGALVSVSGHQRDLSATSYDTSVTLVGIDQTKIGQILDVGLKGCQVQIYRGFYDPTYKIIDRPKLRYTGIVTSYTIQEERVDIYDAFTLSINCSSFKTVLETRIVGRNTNPQSWKNFDPTDVSMDRVAALNNAKFNFGQKLA
jgi:hypothetical protein